MKFATVEDWNFMLNFNRLHAHLYMLSDGKLEPANKHVPWPVVWLLARFNRKHAFISNTPPDIDALKKSLHCFKNKVLWQHYFKAQRETLAECEAFYKFPGLPVANFPFVQPPALKGWLAHLSADITEAATASIRRSRMARCSNILGITKLGFSIMRKKKWVAIINDKETGYTLMSESDVYDIHTSILSSSCYREVPSDTISRENLLEQYRRVCHRISKAVDSDRLGSVLCKSLYIPDSKVAAKLSITVNP